MSWRWHLQRWLKLWYGRLLSVIPVGLVCFIEHLMSKVWCFLEKKELYSHCQPLTLLDRLHSQSFDISFQTNCKPALWISNLPITQGQLTTTTKKSNICSNKTKQKLSALFFPIFPCPFSFFPVLSIRPPVPVLFNKRTLTNAGPNLDKLGWFHLKILNLATSEEIFYPNKVTIMHFWDLRYIFWGWNGHVFAYHNYPRNEEFLMGIAWGIMKYYEIPHNS